MFPQLNIYYHEVKRCDLKIFQEIIRVRVAGMILLCYNVDLPLGAGRLHVNIGVVLAAWIDKKRWELKPGLSCNTVFFP